VESNGKIFVRAYNGDWFSVEPYKKRQDALVLEGEFGEKFLLQLNAKVSCG
jgi:hypothetical protein